MATAKACRMLTIFGSEFVFDPLRWPRDVIDSDFLKLSKIFSAEKSVVRVPDLDPKYKIAVLASRLVRLVICNCDLNFCFLFLIV